MYAKLGVPRVIAYLLRMISIIFMRKRYVRFCLSCALEVYLCRISLSLYGIQTQARFSHIRMKLRIRTHSTILYLQPEAVTRN